MLNNNSISSTHKEKSLQTGSIDTSDYDRSIEISDAWQDMTFYSRLIEYRKKYLAQFIGTRKE